MHQITGSAGFMLKNKIPDPTHPNFTLKYKKDSSLIKSLIY